MSDEGVCRTAPATPGLLITKSFMYLTPFDKCCAYFYFIKTVLLNRVTKGTTEHQKTHTLKYTVLYPRHIFYVFISKGNILTVHKDQFDFLGTQVP